MDFVMAQGFRKRDGKLSFDHQNESDFNST